ASGETKTSCRLTSGIEADLRIVSTEEFPYALMYFTGSKEHNVKLRGIAKKKGLKLNEYGLFRDETLIKCRNEADVYRVLDLDYVPPELREDMGEVEAAQSAELPCLIELNHIRGMFHIHTDYSDGVDSLQKIVELAKRMGLSYIGIADHSKTAAYAGGLKTDKVLRQWEQIDLINAEDPDFKIFKGIESDILSDGRLDYAEDVLKGFDFVIGSVHSQFNLAKEEQEARIVAAMKNPYMTMLGHPTGRLLLSRNGYDVDMRTVIDAAAETGTIIELNASPYRFDIDWRYMKYTKEKGVMISINPDAHSAAELGEIAYGVDIARKGWQEPRDILNTRTASEVAAILRRKRALCH
ncbi:MAG TPA: PHP domain-containing protein, partial [Syntrophorhabdaceae bacterium]|nr:PHP domain-containing protein [Syntrophorhabdaceae bacterium]